MTYLRALCFFLLCQYGWTASLGVVGEVFPVEEESLLKLIERRLDELSKTGALMNMQNAMLKDVQAHVTRPTSLGLLRTEVTRQHQFTPEIVVRDDVLNENGRVLFAKGLKINALHVLTYYQPHWLFLDAEDAAQIRWVGVQIKKMPDAHIILTGGDIGPLASRLQVPIYFDQAGRISKQLGITAVPAIVMRENNALLIQEVAINEDGYAR